MIGCIRIRASLSAPGTVAEAFLTCKCPYPITARAFDHPLTVTGPNWSIEPGRHLIFPVILFLCTWVPPPSPPSLSSSPTPRPRSSKSSNRKRLGNSKIISSRRLWKVSIHSLFRPKANPNPSPQWRPAAGLRGRSGPGWWGHRFATGSAWRPWIAGGCGAGLTAASPPRRSGAGRIAFGPCCRETGSRIRARPRRGRLLGRRRSPRPVL